MYASVTTLQHAGLNGEGRLGPHRRASFFVGGLITDLFVGGLITDLTAGGLFVGGLLSLLEAFFVGGLLVGGLLVLCWRPSFFVGGLITRELHFKFKWGSKTREGCRRCILEAMFSTLLTASTAHVP